MAFQPGFRIAVVASERAWASEMLRFRLYVRRLNTRYSKAKEIK